MAFLFYLLHILFSLTNKTKENVSFCDQFLPSYYSLSFGNFMRFCSINAFILFFKSLDDLRKILLKNISYVFLEIHICKKRQVYNYSGNSIFVKWHTHLQRFLLLRLCHIWASMIFPYFLSLHELFYTCTWLFSHVKKVELFVSAWN